MLSTEKLEFYFEHTMPQQINALKPDTLPLWGRMNATQMLDHLRDGFHLSMEVHVLPPGVVSDKAEKLKAISLTSDRPLPKEFTNPVLELLEKPPLPEHQLAQQRLIDVFNEFKAYYKGKGTEHTAPHNLFGYLNYHEWMWFHYKHVSHHFAQFAMIPYIDRFTEA